MSCSGLTHRRYRQSTFAAAWRLAGSRDSTQALVASSNKNQVDNEYNDVPEKVEPALKKYEMKKEEAN